MIHTSQSETHDRFVAAMTAPAVWALLMRTAATHRDRGPVNLMMVAAQAPTASDVRTREEWEEVGYQVSGTGIGVFTPRDDSTFPPDGHAMTLQGHLRECSTSIEDFAVGVAFDVTQTTAHGDPGYRNRNRMLPLPLTFIEGAVVSELGLLGVDAKVSAAPSEETALLRLQDLAHAWIESDNPEWGHKAHEALSAAHVVARMAGMRIHGPAPVPPLRAITNAGECNAAIKISAIRVIRTARELYERLAELCPCCCGELADRCTSQ